jgi:hypothetical protein
MQKTYITNKPQSPNKAELIKKAANLFRNGHRFVFIYKHLMAQTNDPDLVNEIIDIIKGDQELMQERDAQLNKIEAPKLDYTNIIGGSLAILFALLIKYVLNTAGFWGTLPLLVGSFGVYIIYKELNGMKK